MIELVQTSLELLVGFFAVSIAVYTLARLATLAYFQSRIEYETQRLRRLRSPVSNTQQFEGA